MKTAAFEYGPVARGVYIALLWCALPLGFSAPLWVLPYVLALAFLGLYLRDLLVWSGLYGLFQRLVSHQHDTYNGRLGGRAMQAHGYPD